MKKCCAKKRCDIVEFTLFWRKLQYVANYAFFVLSFGSKIFVCAILYAFSVKGPPNIISWWGCRTVGQILMCPDMNTPKGDIFKVWFYFSKARIYKTNVFVKLVGVRGLKM